MKRLFIMLAVTALMAGGASAGNVDTFGIGAKATSLGGAFSANASDPFAAYYNPAGLVGQQRSVSVGAMILDPNLKVYNYSVDNSDDLGLGVGDRAPRDIEDESAPLTIPSIGFVMPLNDRVALGLAVYVPFGLDISWDDNPNRNPGAYSSTHSWYVRETVTPSVAYKVNDKLALGAGISFGKTISGVERRMFYENADYSLINPALPDLSVLHNKLVETDLEDTFNYSINIGAMYDLTDSVTVGATYRGRTSTTMEGTTEVKDAPVGFTNTTVDSETTVDAPEQLQVGINYHPTDRFNLEFDLVWTNWSIIDGYTVEFEDPLLGAADSEHFERNWEDTKQIRIGGEWMINEQVVLRGGYFYDPSPIPDSTFDLVWPDADKKVYSLGVGYDFGNGLSIDGVVQYIIAEYKRELGGESDTLNESYEMTVPVSGTTANEGEVSMEADGNLFGYGITVNYAF